MRQGLSPDLIARVLGAAPRYTIAQLEEKFPPRTAAHAQDGADTPPSGGNSGAMVTRFAPSPTGFFHTGNLYPTIIDKKLAQQSSGVFILRIEDTDTKREVPGAVDIIVNSLAKFGLGVDEGMIGDNKEIGAYGPYVQSKRKDIYQSVAAELMAAGKAYPCFLTAEEMDEIRAKQSAGGWRTGIYGEWARDRDLTVEEIAARLDKGEVPSIRLYSAGDCNRKIYCKEAIRGSIAFPESDEDIVIIKSNDGLPTYHFAMLCDDHFMRITHVVRGNEYTASLPLHAQLFNVMGWTPPVFIHNATIDILDEETGNRRKLSKRKDRVASVALLLADGWPPESVLEYVFNLAVSGYEEAKMKNLALTIWDYPINIKKLPASGALFDMKKMEWWAKEFIATLPVDELLARVVAWANEYSPDWAARLTHPSSVAASGAGTLPPQGGETSPLEYLRNILAIERDNPKRIRKDFITWSQTLEEVAYFWDDIFEKAEGKRQKAEGIENDVYALFLRNFDINDDKDTWWNKIVAIASQLGIKNGEVAMGLRVALTGRTNTPDLYSIIQVMGAARVKKRVENVLNQKEQSCIK
ncbi:MAG: hypothetical protein LBJ73_00950 [Rickettsiales bacterium]|jgi:glutamyl-tRNA synthetase|nr:hypothetical protein [Rickettsiales bacterium]